jgi:hydroxymethylpyrimidine/phosphomethylpyrimidine kinase
LTNGVDEPVRILVVGGLDPGGGAGLLRDVATAAALGADADAVGTAWTEQGERVHSVEPRAPAAIQEAVRRAVGGRPAAVKIGMAVDPATADAILEGLEGYGGPVVVDPVLATSRGGRLWSGEPREILPLARRATLLTPNAVEVGELIGRPVSTLSAAAAAGEALTGEHGLAAVLVKGGHLAPTAREVTDVLVTKGGTRHFARPRVAGPSPRGTGCALATAIAVELGRGRELAAAVESAGRWLAGAIAAARDVRGERRL